MRTLSVQWKITLLAGLCLLITSLSLIGFSVYNAVNNQQAIKQQSSDSVTNKSQQLLETRALLNATEVSEYLSEAMYRAQMLADTALFFKSNTEENFGESEALRTSLDEMVRKTVVNYPNVQGAYLVFKPNLLDSEDDNYQNADYVGSNEIGRFAAYWITSSNGENVVANVLSEVVLKDEGNSERFACPLTTASACISSPKIVIQDNETFLTSSLSVPILIDGVAIGFFGIDLKLSPLVAIALSSDQSLFGGSGNVFIVSLNNTLIATDERELTLGAPLADSVLTTKEIANLLAEGKVHSQWNSDRQWLSVFAPIQVASQTWGVVFEMPTSSVLADANQLDQIITQQVENGVRAELLVGTLLVFLGLAIIALAATQIVKPIRAVVERLQDIASGEGDLTQRLVISSHDEIGDLARGFNQFLDKLQAIIQQIVESANQVAQTTEQARQSAVQTRSRSESQFKEMDMVATAS